MGRRAIARRQARRTPLIASLVVVLLAVTAAVVWRSGILSGDDGSDGLLVSAADPTRSAPSSSSAPASGPTGSGTVSPTLGGATATGPATASKSATATKSSAPTKKSTGAGGGGANGGGTKPLNNSTVTVAAVGDMACDTGDASFNGGKGTSKNCAQDAVSDMLLTRKPSMFLALGDTQYENGSASDYAQSYDPSFGRLKRITRAIIGNHEYYSGGDAFWDYFGSKGGPRGKGWYSFDLGAWHVVALNANCDKVSCTGEQLSWFKADLARSSARCTLVMWHQPRWSTGAEHGDDRSVQPLWAAAVAGGADVVLNGHDHDYERFAPLDENGSVDRKNGTRQFVVGTGGKNLKPVAGRSTTEAKSAASYGALYLTLKPTSYSWSFAAATGSFSDSGSTTCNG